MKGHFIVIEGLDGTGKTTQIQMLADRLKKDGRSVFVTAEPTSLPTGKLLRRVLSGEVALSPWSSAALFLSDRIAHNTDSTDGIKKHLAAGDTVICDRYYYSTFAYQGSDTDMKWTMDIHFGCPEIEKPALVIFLTMPVEKCLERITANRPDGSIEIYENTGSLTKISRRFDEVFAALDGRENIVRCDASGSIGEVAEKIYEAVKNNIFGD